MRRRRLHDFDRLDVVFSNFIICVSASLCCVQALLHDLEVFQKVLGGSVDSRYSLRQICLCSFACIILLLQNLEFVDGEGVYFGSYRDGPIIPPLDDFLPLIGRQNL